MADGGPEEGAVHRKPYEVPAIIYICDVIWQENRWMRCCLKIHTSSCTLYSRLLELLEEQPLHANALSRTLGMERRLLAYHLAKLEERGFVMTRPEALLPWTLIPLQVSNNRETVLTPFIT